MPAAAFGTNDPDGASGARPEVRIWQDDGAIEIQARLLLAFTPPEIWDVVLDHDRWARFMPNVDSCRVIDRDGSITRVRQVGGIRFFARKIYRSDFEYERVGADRVSFFWLAGDLRDYRGEWRIEPAPDAFELVYRASMPHGLGVPFFLGRGALHRTLRDMLPAVRDELERRRGSVAAESTTAGDE